MVEKSGEGARPRALAECPLFDEIHAVVGARPSTRTEAEGGETVRASRSFLRGVLHNDTQVLSLVRRWRTTCNKEWMAASVFWVNNDGTPSPVHFWFRAFPVPDWLELSARHFDIARTLDTKSALRH